MSELFRRGLAGLSILLMSHAVCAAEYELVLRGGRVIDPETGRDGIYEVAVADGRVAAISEVPLPSIDVLDVSGLVVAPGFIDLHTHSPTAPGLPLPGAGRGHHLPGP